MKSSPEGEGKHPPREAEFLSVESHNENGKTVLDYHSRGYRKARLNLEAYIHELYEKNREAFASEDGVFALFVRSAWSGSLLPVARLIEETNGKGSFRKLAEQTVLNK